MNFGSALSALIPQSLSHPNWLLCYPFHSLRSQSYESMIYLCMFHTEGRVAGVIMESAWSHFCIQSWKTCLSVSSIIITLNITSLTFPMIWRVLYAVHCVSGSCTDLQFYRMTPFTLLYFKYNNNICFREYKDECSCPRHKTLKQHATIHLVSDSLWPARALKGRKNSSLVDDVDNRLCDKTL